MKFITFDLGTGGVKSSLYDEKLHTLGKIFIEYRTYYPGDGMREQRPEDWWQAVVQATEQLLKKTETKPEQVSCVALSGHSCVAVPLDKEKKLLMERVPIWSDTRAEKQTKEFFSQIEEKEWYEKTGNGFPPACYAVFKLMWLRDNKPEMYSQISQIVGSKDYINFKMTGNIVTDHTYAASLGVYNLMNHKIDDGLLQAAGIKKSMIPKVVTSHTIIGEITEAAAHEMGLSVGTKVACGGVDNSCMALGAVGTEENASYVSLGSSSWIPVNTRYPVLDFESKPYVFPNPDGSGFTSAYSIFAGGSSYQWARNVLCGDLPADTAYRDMDMLAAQSPVGANGVIFNPTLAGGTSQDKNVHAKGAFMGLQLATGKKDLLRAVLEGVALNLRLVLGELSKQTEKPKQLLLFGGGSKSKIWMQIFADVFGIKLITTNIDQDAASLGAAAICAKAMKVCEDYKVIPSLHTVKDTFIPNMENYLKYNEIMQQFEQVCYMVADFGTIQ